MMKSIDILEQLKVVDPILIDIATEMQSIEDAYERGDLSLDERLHLINEIRDIRAAECCAGNELAIRHLVQVCNLIGNIVL
jgi:hypothetical protein